MLQCFVLCVPIHSTKFSRLEGFKFIPRLILKWGIRKCQYFDPKLPTSAVANNFAVYLICVLYGAKNGRNKQIGVKNQIDMITIYQYITFLFLLQVCN